MMIANSTVFIFGNFKVKVPHHVCNIHNVGLVSIFWDLCMLVPGPHLLPLVVGMKGAWFYAGIQQHMCSVDHRHLMKLFPNKNRSPHS